MASDISNQVQDGKASMEERPIEWSEVKALVFDAYGTLFDVHSAAAAQAKLLAGHADEVSRTWRQKQLEYSWLYTLMGHYTDFWTLTSNALDHALRASKCGVDATVREKLLRSYLELETFPEVPDTLARLHNDGKRLAILTNGSPEMINAVVTFSRIDGSLDFILSVDEVRNYKPSAAAYQLACDRLNLKPSDICFISSNAWDVAGAAVYGFVSVWVNRAGADSEAYPQSPSLIVPDLSTLGL